MTVKLLGVELDWIKEDGLCREVQLTDKTGFILVIRSAGGYGDSLKVLRIAPENEKAEQDF
jgi:hypothetical protein